MRGIARHIHDYLVRRNGSLRGLYDTDAITRDVKSRYFAVLDDVHAQGTRCTRIAPHHCVMPRYPRTSLQEPTDNREMSVQVYGRSQALDLRGREHLRIDAVHANGVAPAASDFELMLAVRELHQPSLTQHDVEIEFSAQPLVQLQGMIVKG